METATVRDLHLKTSAMLKEVEKGQVFIIENHGRPVAELRPITERRSTKLPDREAFRLSLPRTESGRIIEEDRNR